MSAGAFSEAIAGGGGASTSTVGCWKKRAFTWAGPRASTVPVAKIAKQDSRNCEPAYARRIVEFGHLVNRRR